MSNNIGHSTESCRMDDLVGKGFQILAFRDLPVTHQLAIAHYLSNDCGSWKCFYQGGEATLSEYLSEYGDQRFGVIDLPSQRVVQAVMADPELATSYSSWEQYAAWYCTAGDVPVHDPNHRWPVILSQDNDETLTDGWHRFHSYMRSGCKDIPAIFFPAERHYELAQRKGAIAVKDDSTRKLVEMQTSDSGQDTTLLVLNRAGRVLVKTVDGYDFVRMSTDLRGAVAFDEVGAKEAVTRIQSNLPEGAPYTTQSVRDFKMAIIDSFAPTEEIAQKQNESLPSMRM